MRLTENVTWQTLIYLTIYMTPMWHPQSYKIDNPDGVDNMLNIWMKSENSSWQSIDYQRILGAWLFMVFHPFCLQNSLSFFWIYLSLIAVFPTYMVGKNIFIYVHIYICIYTHAYIFFLYLKLLWISSLLKIITYFALRENWRRLSS
jgi:hypothetical protein